MNFSEILRLVEGSSATPPEISPDVSCAYSSDLLSDVMGHAPDGSVLITIQNHLNTIAVCTLAGIKAIVLCHSRPAPDDMKAAAAREGVAVAISPLSQYEACLALSSLPASPK